jgi:hypothetical protein
MTCHTIHAQVSSFEIDNSKLNKPLMVYLDSIYREDQQLRVTWTEELKARATATQIDSVRILMRQKDLRNQAAIDSLYQQYGWLGPQEVGMQGSMAMFLVIQHADLPYQQKYYPIVKEAERQGKTLSSNVAILEDRISMREGRMQRYGSQGFKDKVTGVSYIYPVLDPDKLDERRKSMGLKPMDTYVKGWDLEVYKQKLPEIERIVREQGIR